MRHFATSLLLALVLATAPAAGQPPVKVSVEEGVPESLGAAARDVAGKAMPFIIADLELGAVPEQPVEVVVARDPQAIRDAARKRGQRVTLGASTAGLTRGDTLYLNAGYFLKHRKKGPRPPAEVALKVAEVTSHELTHVVINRVSRRNVPRWLGEGLAVHESARFLERVLQDQTAARKFTNRRLSPLEKSPPLPLEDLEFGKSAARLFYGADHRVCYASSYAGVRAMVDAFGQGALGRLLRTCGEGPTRRTKIPERRIRWNRGLKLTLNRDPGDLTELRDDWVHRRTAPAVPAMGDDDDLPPEGDGPDGEPVDEPEE